MPNIVASKPINIDRLLTRGRIEIPKYQRSYSWTMIEVKEFLEDLFDAVQHSESWFLGIIYTYDSGDSDGHFSLLDGQQRITTLFILLKELMLFYEVVPDLDIADKIKSFAIGALTSHIFETGTESPRLLLDEANRDEFAQYLRGTTLEEAHFEFFQGGDFAASHELINNAIIQIREWLLQDFDSARGIRDEFENFKKLVNFILRNIELIEIQLDQQSSFYNIFENINDRGRKLTDSDKFKNRYCSLIPKNQIPSFEGEWFQVSKAIYSLKRDLDKHLFGFYFRSIGENDLNEGGFYKLLRQKIQSYRNESDKNRYIRQVWGEVNEMLKVLQEVERLRLIKLYHASPGNTLVTTSKVVNVLVRDTWKQFDQFGVLVFGIFLNFRDQRNEAAYIAFLHDLLNAVRFYLAAYLSGDGANVIRDYTIEIAKGLKEGKTFDNILAENEGALDFAARFHIETLDKLSISNNNISKLLLLLIQASINPELIENYDMQQNWTLEHLLPLRWEENWRYVAEINWTQLNAD